MKLPPGLLPQASFLKGFLKGFVVAAWTLLSIGLVVLAAQDNETVGGFIVVVGIIALVWAGVIAALLLLPWKKIWGEW